MEHDIDWAARVRRSGLRVTSGRVAALEYLEHHPHSSAAQVFAAIREGRPRLTVQSVHNVVNDLCEHGLLRRLSLPDSGGAFYETRTADNHHHIRCAVCGRVEDVDCAVGEAPCLVPQPGHGMPVVLAADVVFTAICADCADRAEARELLAAHDPARHGPLRPADA